MYVDDDELDYEEDDNPYSIHYNEEKKFEVLVISHYHLDGSADNIWGSVGWVRGDVKYVMGNVDRVCGDVEIVGGDVAVVEGRVGIVRGHCKRKATVDDNHNRTGG